MVVPDGIPFTLRYWVSGNGMVEEEELEGFGLEDESPISLVAL